jgi:tRNA modification GTPase
MERKATLLPVANKVDQYDIEKLKRDFPPNEIIFISAKKQINLDQLTKRLLELTLGDKINLNDAIVTNARHVEALTKTEEVLANALQGLNTSITTDFIASDIRRALYFLGEITGEITTDNLLENIFSKFCIGK